VNEHVLAAIIADDEAEALLTVEEFDDTLAFADDLGGHAATTAATAAAETAATAAAEAIAAAATATAEAIAAAAKTASTIAAVTLVTEAVALVPAAARTALTSIETHALQFFPNLAPCIERNCAGRWRINLPARKIRRAKEKP